MFIIKIPLVFNSPLISKLLRNSQILESRQASLIKPIIQNIFLNMENPSSLQEEQQRPLLENYSPNPNYIQKPPKTPTHRAMRKTFKGTAYLANLLPTGSVLIFQLFSPVVTNQGKCLSHITQYLTLGLLALCSLSCILLSFTDSIRDSRGKVRYGIATFKGLWVFDGSMTVTGDEAKKYKIRFVDFMHAIMSALVFVAVALFDQNVVKCFVPFPSDEMKEKLVAVPVGIGLTCSVLFLLFPTKRHGIGFPLSRQ